MTPSLTVLALVGVATLVRYVAGAMLGMVLYRLGVPQ